MPWAAVCCMPAPGMWCCASAAGFPESRRNAKLLPQYSQYLGATDGKVTPNPDYFTRVHGDIRQVAGQKLTPPVDLVFSSSVYEHLDDLKGITSALVSLTAPGGAHLHFIDLRDHYFRYPFEMLCYSDQYLAALVKPGQQSQSLAFAGLQASF